MSNLARKLQQEQQQRTVKEPKKARIKKIGITPGEMVLGLAFVTLIGFGSVQMISKQAQMYSVNKEIQDVQVSITNQQKVNNDLKDQVSELSTYARIGEKAKKLGLQLNENNVKVVQGK
ncbi:MAG: cell division protein FtsL [Bacillota bacterium]|nr:cell division protein FtsL [Bacillota bacterium]MDP4168985.1 cell division protein FtsL [Bacillota bacterium]